MPMKAPVMQSEVSCLQLLSSPSATTIDSWFSGLATKFDWIFQGFFISLQIADFTFLLQKWLNEIT